MKSTDFSGVVCRFLWTGLIVALAGLTACSKEKPTELRRQAVPVTVASVEQKNVPVQITAIGTVEPYSTVSVKTQVTGELTKVNFKQGDFVRQGQLLFVLDQRQIEADIKKAESQLARDQASLANAQAQATRYRELYKQGIISKEQYDAQQTAADTLVAAVDADRADVESSKVQLTYTSIYSPIDGRTGDLLVHQGNMVKANDTVPLVVINKVEPVYVTFSVPEKQLPDIKRFESKGTLTVRADIAGDPKPALGKLSFIDNAVDTATGTIKLKGEFSNADHRLWPGSFAGVSLTLTTEPNAIVIPSAAVQNGQEGQFVFVVKNDKSVEVRNVNVDRANDKETVISSGLQPGETVVTDGQVRLTPGAKVNITNAPTSAAEQAAQNQGSGS